MKRNEIWQKVETALRADKRNKPSFPDHPAAQAGKVVVKAGKLMSLCMEYKYTPQEYRLSDEVVKQQMQDVAINTIVQAIRFLENLK
jgi:hypothetical protein